MEKDPDAFRTISEAATELDVEPHVLRHWESKFGQVRPLKRAGGRRYYRSSDIELLRGVRALLREHGYTTKGVQKLFRDHGARYVVECGKGDSMPPLPMDESQEPPQTETPAAPAVKIETKAASGGIDPAAREKLQSVLTRLEAIREMLN